MRRIFLIFLTLILLNSCKDKCRYVEPSCICGVELKFEVLDSLNKNVFESMFEIDSLLILNEFNDTINHKLFLADGYWHNDYQFSFEIFDCWTEHEKFNSTITKSYLLKYSSKEIDTISFEFKPIDPAGECGGTDFDFLKIVYNNQKYDGSYNSMVNSIYR